MAEIPYEARKSMEWAERLLKVLTKQYVDDEVLFTGECPRCEHRFTQAVPHVTSTLEHRMLHYRSKAPSASAFRGVIFVCRCEEPHPDRPADGHGCGASGRAQVRV